MLPNRSIFDRRTGTSKDYFFKISTGGAQGSREGGGRGQDHQSYYLSCLSGTQLRAGGLRVLLCPAQGRH